MNENRYDLKPNGGYAYSYKEEDGQGGFFQSGGMTLRYYFAGQALIALYSSQGIITKDSVPIKTGIEYTQVAYEIADAMIIARELK